MVISRVNASAGSAQIGVLVLAGHLGGWSLFLGTFAAMWVAAVLLNGPEIISILRGR